MSATKAVIVLGPDSGNNEALIGSLIYKCGMDMNLLQDLEKSGKQRYEEIPPFIRQRGLPLCFETRSGRCTVVDNTQSADAFLYLFKITTPLEETLRFLEKVSPLAKDSGKAKQIVLLDDMEKVQWSASQFGNFTQGVDEYFRAMHDPQALWNVIPVSTVSGDNVLELSSRSPWYSSRNDALPQGRKPCTVIEAIDG